MWNVILITFFFFSSFIFLFRFISFSLVCFVRFSPFLFLKGSTVLYLHYIFMSQQKCTQGIISTISLFSVTQLKSCSVTLLKKITKVSEEGTASIFIAEDKLCRQEQESKRKAREPWLDLKISPCSAANFAGSSFLRNVGELLHHYTESHPKAYGCSQLSLWEPRTQLNKACGTESADVTTLLARLYASLRSCNQTNWIDQATCPNWWYAVMPCCLLLWNTPASHQAEEQLVNQSGIEGVAPSTNISIHGMLTCHFPRPYKTRVTVQVDAKVAPDF